jgi:rSAM/selenodomain-associated transferase 1
MGNEMSQCVVVYAKAPIPGEAKTRLIPAIGAENAAMLHAALIERALENAVQTKYTVELCCAPNADAAFFEDCADTWDCVLSDQGFGGLGERMLRTLDELLSEFSGVAIVGADCPAVSHQHIREAMAKLDRNDVAIIPAEDGGYVLIAAMKTHPEMFTGINWGSDEVFHQQCEALGKVGLRYAVLAPLWDIDRPEDLARLAELKPPLPFTLPRRFE